MAASPPAPSSGRQIGRYLLFGEIAAGGMATVHFGRLSGPAGFARTVAIKRLHEQFAKDPEFVSMFLDEARVAARIRHPNVVPTLDVVATENEIFLVMEYVQGESLARLRRAIHAPLAPADTRILATILAGISHGLHAAHEAKSEQGEPLGIVHRDVSPQNVLVGVDGVSRVLDFGVAKASGRVQTTREGQIKGKLSYMAPEQLHGSSVTRRTDVYAASVVAWEALTGQRLFAADNEAAVVTAILQRPVKPPSEVAPWLPPAFDAVVMRGLERDPERRYATARELALDLEKCGGVASASEVGEWVERLARDELLKRSLRVAEIESASSARNVGIRRSFPSSGEIPTTVVSRGIPPGALPSDPTMPSPGEPLTQVSSVTPLTSGTPSFRRAPRGVLALVGGALAVVGAVVVILHTPGTTSDAAAAATLSPSATSSTAPTPPPEASGTTSEAIETPPPAPSAEAPPSASVVVAAPSHAPAAVPPVPHHPAPSPPVHKAAARDCDPPFTIDALGHKHYKPACLE